jgi:hypothetical protein
MVAFVALGFAPRRKGTAESAKKTKGLKRTARRWRVGRVCCIVLHGWLGRGWIWVRFGPGRTVTRVRNLDFMLHCVAFVSRQGAKVTPRAPRKQRVCGGIARRWRVGRACCMVLHGPVGGGWAGFVSQNCGFGGRGPGRLLRGSEIWILCCIALQLRCIWFLMSQRAMGRRSRVPSRHYLSTGVADSRVTGCRRAFVFSDCRKMLEA